MADQLLATSSRIRALAAAMQTGIAATTATVYTDESFAGGSVPFVLVTASLTPVRTGLDGAWSQAELSVVAESLHATQAQARVLADAVRTWMLTAMTTPGLLDVDTLDTAVDNDPGGVPQVRESWTLRIQRV